MNVREAIAIHYTIYGKSGPDECTWFKVLRLNNRSEMMGIVPA